jgi:hypothetical protein
MQHALSAEILTNRIGAVRLLLRSSLSPRLQLTRLRRSLPLGRPVTQTELSKSDSALGRTRVASDRVAAHQSPTQRHRRACRAAISELVDPRLEGHPLMMRPTPRLRSMSADGGATRSFQVSSVSVLKRDRSESLVGEADARLERSEARRAATRRVVRESCRCCDVSSLGSCVRTAFWSC